METRTETYKQSRWRVALAIVALGIGATGMMMAVNMVLLWPTWALAVIVAVIAALALVLLIKMPVEVVLSSRGLGYSGGVPPRTLFFPWEQVTEVRTRYEPGALGRGPILSAIIVVGRSRQKGVIGRDVGALDRIKDRIESSTLPKLLPPVLRSVDSGGTARFGPLRVSRFPGVSFSALLVKRTIPLAEISGWYVDSVPGVGAFAGPLLHITGEGKNAIGVPLTEVPNAHVLLATLEHLTKQ